MSNITEIDDSKKESDFILNNANAVIFFGAKSCSHCNHITPLYNTLPTKYPHVKFSHVEVSKVKVSNIDQGVPIFVAYKKSIYVDAVLGADKNGLIDMIETQFSS